MTLLWRELWAASLFWTVIGFAAGSLPFSLWIGRYWLKVDIREVGDANPGATNVLRAGGKLAAAAALLLDLLKGALPVGIAYWGLGIRGVWIIPVAIAPVLGHAFSPFLGGRGGKAVATTGGIWMGLTIWEGPTIGGLALGLATYVFGGKGRAVLAALTVMVIYLLVTPREWNLFGLRPEREVIGWVGLLNLSIVAWKHRADFRQRPRLHPQRSQWPDAG